MTPLPKERFVCLVERPYPQAHAAMYHEVEWYSTSGEQLLGTVLLDKTDRDYSWVVMRRDEANVYRAVDLGTSLPSALEARQALAAAMGRE
jgi:hypothetical protein